MYFNDTIRETIEVDCYDGDKPFRAWKKRHGRAVLTFRAVPARRGEAWRIVVVIPDGLSLAASNVCGREYRALKRDYCLPDYTAPTAEYIRQQSARDARRAPGYDMATDPLTVEAAARAAVPTAPPARA